MNSPVAIATHRELLANTLCTVTVYMYIVIAVYRVIINIIGVPHYIFNIINIIVLQNACSVLYGSSVHS